jgi:hypothetical protein
MLFLGGFVLSYQLFLQTVNVSQLGSAEGGEPVDFRYDGVSYFHGTALHGGQNYSISFFAPWIFALANVQMEVFVEVPQDQVSELSPDTRLGTVLVYVNQPDAAEPVTIRASRLHRFVVDLKPTILRQNTLVIRYRATEAGDGMERAAQVSGIDQGAKPGMDGADMVVLQVDFEKDLPVQVVLFFIDALQDVVGCRKL